MFDVIKGYEGLLALMVLFIPLLSSLVTFMLSKDLKVKSGIISTSFLAIGFMLATFLGSSLVSGDEIYLELEWLTFGNEALLTIGLHLDALTGLMLIIVTLISFLVHMFSMGYMAGDASYRRYFGLLGLFTFSMLGIVLADNLLQLFMFWELVGFSSYLLIGFWFSKPSASLASQKAFIVNRIGDIGFLVAIMIFWSQYGTLNFQLLGETSIIDPFWIKVASIGLFFGVIGKSAQFPLQIWLPDAMEGPTPVSALIHAATMVVAGVFLLARTFPLFSPDILELVSIVGAITAFTGAVAAINQYDIKKVLAFSTISQLGYMVVGIGVGATGGAIFHLATHAFFKACLFLSAGAIIYWMHRANGSVDAQDMRNMGGLRKKLPLVFITFLLSAMALAGLPFFSGFLSKDAILTGVWQQASLGSSTAMVVMLLSFGSIVLTGYYMTRQVLMVFFGASRMESHDLSSSIKIPLSMKIPLIILSVGATWVLFSFNPLNGSSSWVMNLFASDFEFNIPHGTHTVVSLLASALSLIGIALGYSKFRTYKLAVEDKGVEHVFNLVSTNHWYLDKIAIKGIVVPALMISTVISAIDKLIDRLVNYFGVMNVMISRVVGWGDRYLIDGVVHTTTAIVARVGKTARNAPGNEVQRYIITAISFTVIIAIVIALYLNNINQ